MFVTTSTIWKLEPIGPPTDDLVRIGGQVVLPDFWQTKHPRGLIVDGHSLVQDEPPRVFDLSDEVWPHEPAAELYQERFEGQVVNARKVEARMLARDDAAPDGDTDRAQLMNAFIQPKLLIQACSQWVSPPFAGKAARDFQRRGNPGR